MPKPEESAEVTAAGTIYRDWESVEVERRFGNVISHARMRVAEIGDTAHGWKSLRLKPHDPASVSLAGRKVIEGEVSVRQVAFTATSHQIEIIVASKTMSLPISTPKHLMPGQFKNSTLSQIANATTAPYGIAFKLAGSPAGAEKPFERVSVHYGETALQFIERLSRMRDIHLRDDESGNLLGGRADSGAAASAEIVEGKNIEAAHGIMQIAEEVSEVQVTGQNTGTDDHWGDDARDLSATATNSDFGGYRPLQIVAEMPGDKKDMALRANHEVAYNLGTVVEIFVTVPGWLMDDGSLWIEHLGAMMTIYSPMMFPTDSMSLALRGVTHRQNSETGTTSLLEFCLPNALSAGGMIPVDGFPAQAAPAEPDSSDEGH